ncbi:sensor histidine kinase [Mucilaginibacter glaciei]|uniref:histidine kinase n=1 Tax=Mucilaginibacter glaciei TaxID=2772109 RepID=A0A926NQT7_9SPHI|nr:ATP-binding protein [Mucilaginibacter glaciei]MBD1393347.1 hypothetical protein [Mucilaginibacter glaciei]
MYVLLYNRNKKKHAEEKMAMQVSYETELLKTQMEVQEQTFKTIAYNLHDNIGQLLSLMTITLSSVNVNDTARTAEKIATVEDLTKRSMKEVKALSRLLQGDELLGKGLTTAIEAELDFLQRSDRYKISFTRFADIVFDDSSKAIIVFRLFQEIVNNIIQHARATEIFVTLEQVSGMYKIIMRDNGIGFNVDEKISSKTGMGLLNITKRAALIKGTAYISSIPDQGTVIILNIPIAQ